MMQPDSANARDLDYARQRGLYYDDDDMEGARQAGVDPDRHTPAPAFPWPFAAGTKICSYCGDRTLFVEEETDG